MPNGTPGFIGSRLREARESRRISSGGLAELIGVSRAGVSLYETGRSSPSGQVFEKIMEKLNLPAAFFFRPADCKVGLPQHTVFERSRVTATKSTRMYARHRRGWLREIVQYLDRFVEFPTIEFPEIDGDSRWPSWSRQTIEDIARFTRNSWGLRTGPISDVTLLCEKHGAIVSMIPMNDSRLDAFSTWDPVDGRPYIVLGSDTQSAFRTRFNVCHELGHLVLHRKVTPEKFEDREYFRFIESQADQFAAAFLTPAESFSADIDGHIPSLDLFMGLKSRWKVSIKMMVHRAQELNIIDREEARRMYINYNRRRWNRMEPLDESFEVEKPRLVRRVFETVIENSVVDRLELGGSLPFSQEDIEQVANLPHGYLDEESAYTWALRDAAEWAEGTRDS